MTFGVSWWRSPSRRHFVASPPVEIVTRDGAALEAKQALALHLLELDPADTRRGTGKELVHEARSEAHRLEDLCAHVALQGGDPHLAQHFQHALLERADISRPGRVGIQSLEQVVGGQPAKRLEGEPRIGRRSRRSREAGRRA